MYSKLIGVAFLCSLFSVGSTQNLQLPEERLIVGKNEEQEPEPAATGFNAAVHGAGSKYFQYIHVPAKDHYEHGHKRGNEHHFIERHEKAQPHAGEFKTKVRWGDKHGGYGEHYWDYNHAGHHDGDSDGTHQNEEYAAYEEEESQQVPVSLETNERKKRQQGDVEFINDAARVQFYEGHMQKHGGNYRRAKDFRGKREKHVKPTKANSYSAKFKKPYFVQ